MKEIRIFKRYQNIKDILLSLALTLSAFALIVMYVTLERQKYQLIVLAISFIAFAAIFAVFNLFRGKARKVIAIILASILSFALLSFGVNLAIAPHVNDTTYVSPTVDREVFKDRKILLLVPHEDDEINVLAGVMEEYTAAGSQVKIVFSTAGDYYGQQDLRIPEAIAAAAFYGVPASDVIFLGYGDRWDGLSYGHIYNAPGDEVVTSKAGYNATYAAGGVAPYKYESYTRDNLLNDFKDIITDYLPDTIFCIDYDSHPDHRSVSLLFEEAMSDILSERSDYTPYVYKGFAYSTAWYGKDDFYADNVKSTVAYTDRPSPEFYMEEVNYYVWKDRIRFPVDGKTLAYTIYGSSTYDALAFHATQDATDHATRIVNSDKIFFQRDTTSLLYRAKVSVSSNKKNAYKLTDFKIADSTEIVNEWEHAPFDGVWTPENNDAKKKVTVKFSSPTMLKTIRLYDSPSLKNNILNAVICFDDGTQIETGALYSNGKGTDFTFEQKNNVNSFTVEIKEWEGKAYGLAEIEAYGDMQDNSENAFIKLQDENEDFAYDYTMGKSATFSLYAYATSGNLDDYDVTLTGDKGVSFTIEEGKIIVDCKSGNSGILTVTSKDGKISDSIRVRNLNLFELAERRLKQNMINEWTFQHLSSYYSDLWKYITKKV